MTSSPGSRISVCLLTFNHAHTVEPTIRSILDQSISDYEIIVSDDCSTDGTWEKVAEIAASDPRVKLIRTPYNMGMPGNANYAVEQSQRPYIALLHHDDIYRNDLLKKWSGVLDRNPDVAFVFNPYAVYKSDHVHEDPMPGEDINGHWLLTRYLFGKWGSVVRGTAMIRKDAWQQIGGMRPRFDLLSDVDMWMRLAMRWNVGYVAEPVICMREEKPEYYPVMYQYAASWQWRRQGYLYEIHATNRLDYLKLNTVTGRLQWWKFRIRLGIETIKWLGYAVVRKKPRLIHSSEDGASPYDLWPVRVVRFLLRRAYALVR
jgi:glycosyltransferase involved in cell wall biosynthesis